MILPCTMLLVNKYMEALRVCMAVPLEVSFAWRSYGGHPNALPLLSQMHCSGQAVSLPQEVAFAISNHLPQDWKNILQKDGVLSLLLGMFFKPTNQSKTTTKPLPHLPDPFIASPALPPPPKLLSALPLMQRPSLSVMQDEFSQLPCEPPLSAPFPRFFKKG